MAGFLDGMRVLDRSQGIAGPACATLRAAGGADALGHRLEDLERGGGLSF